MLHLDDCGLLALALLVHVGLVVNASRGLAASKDENLSFALGWLGVLGSDDVGDKEEHDIAAQFFFCCCCI